MTIDRDTIDNIVAIMEIVFDRVEAKRIKDI
jgi:hypothetical protein